MAKAARRTPSDRKISDPYETACDEAIAACNGDLRSTIRALLIVNEFLEHELREARAGTPECGQSIA